MAVGIFIVLRNSYRTPFHFDSAAQDDAGTLRIELSEEVTFFNKASIQRTLAELPDGTRVIIDASRTLNLDPDVMEIIEEQQVRSKDRGVNIELVCATEKAPQGTKNLTAGVIRAAKKLVRRN
jgi:MFS superfamily sulfate permease-like transporter